LPSWSLADAGWVTCPVILYMATKMPDWLRRAIIWNDQNNFPDANDPIRIAAGSISQKLENYPRDYLFLWTRQKPG